MPCNCDHLEPSDREVELQRAARLLIYVNTKLGTKIESWISRQAKDIYACDERLIPLLCETVRALSKEEREKIIYDAHSKRARELADWWEEHQEIDRLREVEEAMKRKRVALKALALSKLSPEEIDALDLE